MFERRIAESLGRTRARRFLESQTLNESTKGIAYMVGDAKTTLAKIKIPKAMSITTAAGPGLYLTSSKEEALKYVDPNNRFLSRSNVIYEVVLDTSSFKAMTTKEVGQLIYDKIVKEFKNTTTYKKLQDKGKELVDNETIDLGEFLEIAGLNYFQKQLKKEGIKAIQLIDSSTIVIYDKTAIKDLKAL